MVSRKRREIWTLLSLSTRAQNRRHKCRARAALVLVLDQDLVPALGSGGDSVGGTAFRIALVGATAMAQISGPLITLKAASWPTLSTREPIILCGAEE